MSDFAKEQLEELKVLCPNVAACEEGGVQYFLLPGLKLPAGCNPQVVDALLCPTPRDGYECRFYFSAVVKQGFNWHQQNVRIIDRSWAAFSWRINQTGLRLAQMVTEFLRALK
jgi:hypothetical protein